MIRTKSVNSPINKRRDGLRVLVTRFRGRYMPINRYDVWMPNLAPSEKLLRSAQEDRITWSRFAREYKRELWLSEKVDRKNWTIKNHGQKFTLRLLKHLAMTQPVTLMCHCGENQQRCHRHLLKKFIKRKSI